VVFVPEEEQLRKNGFLKVRFFPDSLRMVMLLVPDGTQPQVGWATLP